MVQGEIFLTFMDNGNGLTYELMHKMLRYQDITFLTLNTKSCISSSNKKIGRNQLNHINAYFAPDLLFNSVMIILHFLHIVQTCMLVNFCMKVCVTD